MGFCMGWLSAADMCRDEAGELRAFHNVCRHHAAAVATGSGTADNFTCPYHGWVYGENFQLIMHTSRLAFVCLHTHFARI